MSNKISGLSGNPVASIDAGRPAGKTRDGASTVGSSVSAGSSSAGDASASVAAGDVHITDSASQLASLEQSVRSLPAVDPARVAQFRTAIEAGTYTVQPQHVAGQLMQLEKALGQLPEG